MSTIRVTAEHIEQGERNNPMACPIALAIIEQHWREAEVDVIDGHAYASGDSVGPADYLKADLSDEADDFVNAFDKGEAVQPFEFPLTWVDPDGSEVTP